MVGGKSIKLNKLDPKIQAISIRKHLDNHILTSYITICPDEEKILLNFNLRFLRHKPSLRNVEAFLERNALVSHIEDGEVFEYCSIYNYYEEQDLFEFHMWEPLYNNS